MAAKLTEKIVKAALAQAKAEAESDEQARAREIRGGAEMGGLSLRITASGSAFWYLNLGRALKRKLGAVSPSFPLSMAWAHAQRLRAEFELEGIKAIPTMRQKRRLDRANAVALDAGMPVVGTAEDGLTLREFIADVYEPWLRDQAGDDAKLQKRAADEIQRLLALPMEPLLERPLAAIDRAVLEAWQSDRLTQPTRRGANRKGEPTRPQPLVSRRTVHREVTTVKTILKRAGERGYQTGDVAGTAQVLRKTDRITGNERTRVVTPDEFDALRQSLASDAYKDTDLRVAVLLAYYTGAREGELLDLSWDHVDLVNRQTVHFERTKTDEPRIVPLHPDAALVLDAWKAKCGSKTWVFRHRDDARKRRGPFKASWASLRTEIGAHDLWFHDLRRTCATYLAEAGAPVQYIARLLGHSWGAEAAITARYARHMTAESIRPSVELLPSLLPTAE